MENQPLTIKFEKSAPLSSSVWKTAEFKRPGQKGLLAWFPVSSEKSETKHKTLKGGE